MVGTIFLLSEGQDGLPVHLAHIVGLFELDPQFPVLLLEVINVQLAVICHFAIFKL